MPLTNEDIRETLIRIERQGADAAQANLNLQGNFQSLNRRFDDLEGRFDNFQRNVFGSKAPGRSTPFSGMAAVTVPRPSPAELALTTSLNGGEDLKKASPKLADKDEELALHEEKTPDTPRKPALYKQTEIAQVDILNLRDELGQVKAIVQASIKSQGIAPPTPEGEPDPSRAEKLVTFLLSERGVSFVIKLFILFGIAWQSFSGASHGSPPSAAPTEVSPLPPRLPAGGHDGSPASSTP